MTTLDPIRLAVADGSIAVSATGALAVFNEVGVLGPLDVHAAMVIARLWGETDEQVILAAALVVRGTRSGHVCIRLATQREAVVVDGQDPEIVDALPWPDPALWEVAVVASALVGDGSGDEPLVLVEDRLYLERYFRYEEQVADLILARVAEPRVELDAGLRAAFDAALPDDGDGDRQRLAVETALAGRFTVIAGGPGTGKTYTVAALLATLAAGSPDGELPQVALAAPTGKAAARLTEAVAEYAASVEDQAVREWLLGIEAKTMHRLLGWTWGRGQFVHHARNPLPYDWLIVDELSMVSLPLAAKLLDAVRPEAAVVLVGDPFQLTAIEAGTVLSDIVGPATDDVPEARSSAAISDRVVVLELVHRFEETGAIAEFAAAVRVGNADAALDVLGGGGGNVTWIENRASIDFSALWERVVEQRATLVQVARSGRKEEALQRLGELAILCAHRQGPASVARWQRDLETALDDRFTGLRYHGEWYPGRPVMITSNDYTLNLFNGDIGVAVDTDEGLRVVFDRGGIRTFSPSHLGERTTVHALTIHKSQGSQFEEVVVVLPQETSRLLTRELLYTAVTRASGQVTVIGDESVLRQAVERSVQRTSGLGVRLWDGNS